MPMDGTNISSNVRQLCFFIGVYDVCINVKHKKGYVCVMNI